MSDNIIVKKSSIIKIATVLIILIMAFGVGRQLLGRSESALKNNIANAIRKEDGALFLKQFDQETQKSPVAQLGAESVVKILHDQSIESPMRTAQLIMDSQKIPGLKNQYIFQFDQIK